MHSAIDKAKKNSTLFLMSDWKNIFLNARSKTPNRKPYKPFELKFNDFYDLHSLSAKLIKNKNIDDKGDKVNWLKIKSLKYEKCQSTIIQYKYSHTSPCIKRSTLDEVDQIIVHS